MFNLHFDPVTTELVVGKKKKVASSGGEGNTATLSALLVTTPLELQVNNLKVIDFVEITESGAFSVNFNSAVEVR